MAPTGCLFLGALCARGGDFPLRQLTFEEYEAKSNPRNTNHQFNRMKVKHPTSRKKPRNGALDFTNQLTFKVAVPVWLVPG
jgi:hypothetical protein